MMEHRKGMSKYIFFQFFGIILFIFNKKLNFARVATLSETAVGRTTLLALS